MKLISSRLNRLRLVTVRFLTLVTLLVLMFLVSFRFRVPLLSVLVLLYGLGHWITCQSWMRLRLIFSGSIAHNMTAHPVLLRVFLDLL